MLDVPQLGYNEPFPLSSTTQHMRKIMFLLLAVLLIAATSCNRNGFGCKGKSKIITRVK
jgi:hypothetical protein